MVLDKTLEESPLDCKESKPINPKENQPWISIGKTDTKAEVPILWPLDAKIWLIGKDPHNGHKFEQTLGDSEGQGSLMCCAVVHGVANSGTHPRDWTTAIYQGKNKIGITIFCWVKEKNRLQTSRWIFPLPVRDTLGHWLL